MKGFFILSLKALAVVLNVSNVNWLKQRRKDQVVVLNFWKSFTLIVADYFLQNSECFEMFYSFIDDYFRHAYVFLIADTSSALEVFKFINKN